MIAFVGLEVIFMTAKKAKSKPKAKSSAKEPSWDQIGKMIGKKIEKEKDARGSWCKPWPPQPKPHGHFFGALLFGIILAVILNQQGILLEGVAWWIQVLLVAGWAFMWS